MTYNGPLPPPLLLAAASLYYGDGLGFERVASELKLRWPDFAQTSDRRFGRRIQAAFLVNGWPARTSEETRRRRDQTHTCAALTKKGHRCRNAPTPGRDTCSVHSSTAPAPRRDHFDLVDSEPFIVWLRARTSERGGHAGAARLTGIQKATIGKLLRTGGTTRPGKVTRRYIERALATAIANDPDLIVPRFSDLYELVTSHGELSPATRKAEVPSAPTAPTA
jgi:hypothetical protein